MSISRQANDANALAAEQRREFDRGNAERHEASQSAFPFLRRLYGQERRVNVDYRCPICGQRTWCMVYGPAHALAAVLCMRERNGCSRPVAFQDGEGYLHELPGSYPPTQRPPGYRTTANPEALPHAPLEPRRNYDEWLALHARCVESLVATPAARDHFAASIGIPVEIVTAFEVGWFAESGAYSCPMRGAAGEIIGIHLRTPTGSKFAVTDSRNGLYSTTAMHQPGVLEHHELWLGEGLTDVMTLTAWGLPSLGRHSATGGGDHILRAVKRLKPHTVLIVPDNDRSGVGLRGAHTLAQLLICMRAVQSARVVELPNRIKDVRQFAVTGGRVDDLLQLAQNPKLTINVPRR